MKSRDKGRLTSGSTSTAPCNHDTVGTVTSFGPKAWRKTCCNTRLTPQVASKVSSGRRYRNWIKPRSISQPNENVTANATRMPTTKKRSIAPGISHWNRFAVA